MAFKGKIISNPFNKQTITFLTTSKDSGGKLLEMISTWEPGGSKPVEHYHPNQDEYFSVREGKLNVSLNGKQIILSKGESLQIPRAAVHSMWNSGDKPVTAEWKVYPALGTEYLLETSAGLANNGHVNTSGAPGLLESALVLTKYHQEFRITKPPFPIQKIVFSILRPFALLKRKESELKKYID